MRMSQISAKRNTAMLDGDWVTIGVIASKSDQKVSANVSTFTNLQRNKKTYNALQNIHCSCVYFQGNQYNVWKLTDLDNCDELIHFYLFKDVNKALWKTAQGSVIGLLNPTLMKNTEKVKKCPIPPAPLFSYASPPSPSVSSQDM